MAQARSCRESACSDHARCGWSCAAWQHHCVQGFCVLGGPGPPGSQRDALFLASFRIRGLFSFFILSQSRFRFTSPEMMLSSSLSSLGVPQKGLADPVPLDYPVSVLDNYPCAVDLLVEGQLLCGQPPGLPVGVGAAPGRLSYGGAGIVSGYTLVSLVHVQGGAVRLGRIISGHDPGQYPEVRRVLLEQCEIVGAAGGSSAEPQYPFSGVG